MLGNLSGKHMLWPILFLSCWSVHMVTKGLSSSNLWYMENSCDVLGLDRVRKHSIFLILEIWNLKQVSIN